MELTRLLKDDDAVSPVIGVILMVAITVILAAVIASFVLGLGNNATNTSPQASFGFDFEETDAASGDGVVTVSHDGGDTLLAQELYVRGSGIKSPTGGSPDITAAGSWTTGPYSSGSEVTSGNRITVGASSDYEIDIVWESEEGSTSSTLGSDEGPDA